MTDTKTVGKRPRRPDSGEALLEMALVLPILLVLSMGMLDFGRAFHAKSVLDQAAREGARVAVVSGTPQTGPDVAAVQTRVATFMTLSGFTTGVGTPSVSEDPTTKMVTVQVTYTFQFVTPGLFQLLGANYGNTITMTGKSAMRYEDGT